MTKQLMVGTVPVGGGAAVSIQSMCNTKTDDVEATVAQIKALEAAGCEIIRVAIPDPAAAVSTGAPWKGSSGRSTAASPPGRWWKAPWDRPGC